MTDQSRQPRGVMKVNGVIMPGWIEFEVDNNTFYQADTFRVKFAISGLPPAYGPLWWASQPSIDVEIMAGFPVDAASFSASELTSLIYGRTDNISYEPSRRFIEVSGRDLTSKFIDAKTSEKFTNQTSSQIATTLAARHGLTPVVTSTSGAVGKYYQIEKASIAHEMTEWDLLTWLAQHEQFVVYVKGKELHFEPKPQSTQTPYVLTWQEGPVASNTLEMSFDRNLTIAQDIIVKVRSWMPKSKTGFTVTAKKQHTRNAVLHHAAGPKTEPQTYSYVFSNLTHQQAQEKANALLEEISQHEMKVTAKLPADDLLTVTSIIRVKGTGTAFDQIYHPDSITRSISMSEGYIMKVRAKNQSPETTVLS